MRWATQRRKVNELLPYEHNPRQMTEKQNRDLEASLKKFDLVEIPAINTDNTILAGHQRLRIMQALGRGEEEIDVRVPDRQLTEKEVQEYNIRSNKNTGEWDFESLANNFEVGELLEWGFDEKELKIEQEVIEDEAPEVDDGEPVSKLGEVYQLGRHRLMCGDSTKIEDVEKLMDGQRADLILTDPPYNMGYTGSATSRRTAIANDKISNFQHFVNDFMSAMTAFSKSSAPYYVFTCEEEIPTIKNGFTNSGLKPHQVLIWKKHRNGFGGSDFQHQYEPLVYGWKSHSDRYMVNDRTLSDVWEFDRPRSSDLHPTMKPIALLGHALNNSSKTDDVVMDLFLGSGSTLIACEQTNRNCYGMELDPKYCDVIRKRYAKFIGKEDKWQEITPAV